MMGQVAKVSTGGRWAALMQDAHDPTDSMSALPANLLSMFWVRYGEGTEVRSLGEIRDAQQVVQWLLDGGPAFTLADNVRGQETELAQIVCRLGHRGCVVGSLLAKIEFAAVEFGVPAAELRARVEEDDLIFWANENSPDDLTGHITRYKANLRTGVLAEFPFDRDPQSP